MSSPPTAGEDINIPVYYLIAIEILHNLNGAKYKFEHSFADGTKIEANANKYTFVWRKSTNKFQARLIGPFSGCFSTKTGAVSSADNFSVLIQPL
jgi:hypothetical protein